MRGYRKAAVVGTLALLVCALAWSGVDDAAPYSALAGLGAAFCGANLFEHRANGGES